MSAMQPLGGFERMNEGRHMAVAMDYCARPPVASAGGFGASRGTFPMSTPSRSRGEAPGRSSDPTLLTFCPASRWALRRRPGLRECTGSRPTHAVSTLDWCRSRWCAERSEIGSAFAVSFNPGQGIVLIGTRTLGADAPLVAISDFATSMLRRTCCFSRLYGE